MSSTFKMSHSVVKKNKKISSLILSYLISLEILKISCFNAKKNAFFLVLTKNPSRFLAHSDIGPADYTPTKKDLSRDVRPLYSVFYSMIVCNFSFNEISKIFVYRSLCHVLLHDKQSPKKLENEREDFIL